MDLDRPVSPLDDWALDPAVVHLNHGSYGGCPRAVVRAADALRTRLEAAPMRFLVGEWQPALDRARTALAAFVGVDPAALVLVPNATTAVAIAIHSLALAPGDVVIATDHTYRACQNQLARTGATIEIVPIALPFDPDQLVDAFARALERQPHARAALLDHITSPTALVLPIERILPLLHARAITTIVDGAHAPGQLDLAIAALAPTYYAGNCHKWLCAPKGAGFLAVPDAAVRARIRPVVTSHGASPEYGPANRFHAELDWAGTHDPTPFLAIPDAIAAIRTLGGSWSQTIARNHALAVELRARASTRPPLAPTASLGTMASMPITLPANLDEAQLQARVLADGWELPIVTWPAPHGPLVRLSAHLYNDATQAEAVARYLRSLDVAL